MFAAAAPPVGEVMKAAVLNDQGAVASERVPAQMQGTQALDLAGVGFVLALGGAEVAQGAAAQVVAVKVTDGGVMSVEAGIMGGVFVPVAVDDVALVAIQFGMWAS